MFDGMFDADQISGFVFIAVLLILFLALDKK